VPFGHFVYARGEKREAGKLGLKFCVPGKVFIRFSAFSAFSASLRLCVMNTGTAKNFHFLLTETNKESILITGEKNE